MPDLSRYDDVLALIRDHAATTAEVRLVVVGGSAATGRYDRHSDLDVELWVDGAPDATYDEVALTPLVELLRMEHCPARHDFGGRHLDADLPEGYAERLHELLPGPDLGDRATRVFAWTDELLARRTPGADLGSTP